LDIKFLITFTMRLPMRKNTIFAPNHILCPVDFSELSMLALKYAVAGARAYGAKLTILHSESFELPRYFSRYESDKLVEELASSKKMIKKELEAYVAKDVGMAVAGLEVRYELTEENPVDAISKEAGKGSVDLIVIGTQGLHGFKRLMLGSTAESVIHSARVPLFTIRQKQHEFIDVSNTETSVNIKRVLCAGDVKSTDRPVLEHAISVSERFNARLTVLYSDESEGRKDLALEKESLCSWVSESAGTRCEVEPVVRKGGAADQIIAFAKEDKSDLVVIGARHKSFHDSTILGKTTNLVVRHAPAPVLIIPV
jgi:nucleotide-binding universal stress UspA family protein